MEVFLAGLCRRNRFATAAMALMVSRESLAELRFRPRFLYWGFEVQNLTVRTILCQKSYYLHH